MNRLASVALLGLTLSFTVIAAPARADDTILRLAETATIMVSPDELAATLRAEAAAPTAQEAQKRVNDLMRDAVATAKQVDGITISTGAYNVWRAVASPAERPDRSERWQAGQSLSLTGRDAGSMLKLIGDLQQKGLAQGNLMWRLSREAERKAREDATRQALARLRGRVDEAAEVLGMKFVSFREIRLDSVNPPPMMPRQAMLGRGAVAAAASPPSAEAEELPVTASAEAEILLKPR